MKGSKCLVAVALLMITGCTNTKAADDSSGLDLLESVVSANIGGSLEETTECIPCSQDNSTSKDLKGATIINQVRTGMSYDELLEKIDLADYEKDTQPRKDGYTRYNNIVEDISIYYEQYPLSAVKYIIFNEDNKAIRYGYDITIRKDSDEILSDMFFGCYYGVGEGAAKAYEGNAEREEISTFGIGKLLYGQEWHCHKSKMTDALIELDDTYELHIFCTANDYLDKQFSEGY